MSRLVSRILLSIFMFPLATIFYIFCMVITEQTVQMGTNYRERESVMFLVSSFLTWMVVALYWCLLWRSGVNWNSSRVRRTILAALGASAFGGLAGVFAGLMVNNSDASFGIFVGGVLTIILWLVATVFIWRETTAERADRIKGAGKSAITCPTCGYNLTGLSEARCPECGSKFTLNELMTLQLNADKEIE
jgi:hypothetical protein